MSAKIFHLHPRFVAEDSTSINRRKLVIGQQALIQAFVREELVILERIPEMVVVQLWIYKILNI